MKMTAAMANGSQPPCTTLVAFAARIVTSEPPKTTPATTSFQVAQCHDFAATTRNSAVVISRVPVTARPYAVASRAEERNPSINTSTPANIIQFIAGT